MLASLAQLREGGILRRGRERARDASFKSFTGLPHRAPGACRVGCQCADPGKANTLMLARGAATDSNSHSTSLVAKVLRAQKNCCPFSCRTQGCPQVISARSSSWDGLVPKQRSTTRPGQLLHNFILISKSGSKKRATRANGPCWKRPFIPYWLVRHLAPPVRVSHTWPVS